jgi:predicted transcriptional regulator|tara:strand:- start:1508 stop:2227 length:720 start_codon:yes stop_codon:yes gene_type:complete
MIFFNRPFKNPFAQNILIGISVVLIIIPKSFRNQGFLNRFGIPCIPKRINISYDIPAVMITEISEIKTLRKKLGLTQSQLSKIAGVSQSLIAKIEADRIDPTYTKVKKIFTALSDFGKKHELKADDIMNKKIISVKPGEKISEAIKKMRKFGISQMPVIDEHKSIGVVSEAIILDSILEKKGNKIKEIMQDPPPIVSKNTPVAVISQLLHSCPMVLVSESGKLNGVITRSDILAKTYSR